MNQCEVCGRSYKTHGRFLFHMFYELCFMFIFVAKIILWEWYTLKTFPDAFDRPCAICFHSASSHIIEFETDPELFPPNMTAFKALFYVHLRAKRPFDFSDCLRCIFKRYKTDEEAMIRDHSYYPLNNLEYLEHMYKKGDK